MREDEAKKVKELVEWVSSKILEYDGRKPIKYGVIAREILSHPGLALIDREAYGTNHYGKNWHPVIPLAEAIKEVESKP